MDVAKIKEYIEKSPSIKPSDFVIDDLKWKFAVRNVLRSKNILLTGHSGCGKTKFVKSISNAFNRIDRFFKFNIGAMQDARSSLIGNTMYTKEKGTHLIESDFVRAIQTENAIILLDELSRGHYDAHNILMSVLDDTQRYIRLDEKGIDDIIEVAKGVTFFATANIGSEYTATCIMDRALVSRFPVTIEMDFLGHKDEIKLLSETFTLSDDDLQLLDIFINIANYTRKEVELESGKLSNLLSTRHTFEIAELIQDGFALADIVELVVYPLFDDQGGSDSERTHLKQYIQQFNTDTGSSNLF